LNLYALSYGTRAAQVYARDHPDSVRTIYLGSVVPIDIAMPLPFARSAHDVLGKTLDACANDPACHAAFPDLRKEKDAVFARLAAGDIRAPVGERRVVTSIDAGRIAERLRSMTYRPAGAAAVPWALHRAFLGDWRPFTDGIVGAARAVDADMSQGVFFSITCNEDVRFIRESDIAQAVGGTELGDYRVRQQQAACAQWPISELPPGYREAVRSDVPTLFVSGDLDPATPLSFTAHASQGFSHRADLVMRGSGHTESNECVARAYSQLVRSGSVDALDTNCEPTPRPPFKIAP
jgi:pimeloyl-ACP methyl ester carboxylesterase